MQVPNTPFLSYLIGAGKLHQQILQRSNGVNMISTAMILLNNRKVENIQMLNLAVHGIATMKKFSVNQRLFLER